MAVTWPTQPYPDGTLIDDDIWNTHVDNLNDLNTRIGTGNGTALATRVSSLETLTGNTGTTGHGNTTLSSRLGTGVTTSSTATSQFTALGNRATALESAVGIPWSGGTALSRIVSLENSATAKYQLVLTLAADQNHATTSGGGNAAYHKILFPTPDVNVGFTVGSGPGGSNPSGTNITIPATGWYMASMSVRWQANATGQRTAFLASTANAEGLRYLWGSTDGWTLNASGWPKIQDGQPVYLTSGTQLSPWAFQTSGATIPISSFAGATSLRLLFLG